MQGEKAALVLTGGGARAAYQVGVLQAIREIRGARPGNPFPILCGTSAGGINAVALAVFSADFNTAVRKLAWIWRNFHVDKIYRADALALLATGARWGAALTSGWAIRQTPRSLLDNAPLRELLARVIDFDAIDRSIASGGLHAVSVSASGYSSGESLAFFQAAPEVPPWQRAQRIGVRTRLGIEHLLATSAIPFVFPAVRINREYFGDGSMRQLAPISPAIHLGADRVLVIGSGRLAEEGRQRSDAYPSPAQIAGHALSSIFLDSLAVDLERMQRINQTLSAFTAAQREAAGMVLRPIETLVISPSQRLDAIAGRHRGDLPRALRLVLRGVGAMRREGSTLLSYLLFEPGFTRALMELGYQDGIAKRDEVATFLRV
ncbi:patatin-like phospholipase family protein [Rhodocyclaceae bacterium SMB388]